MKYIIVVVPLHIDGSFSHVANSQVDDTGRRYGEVAIDVYEAAVSTLSMANHDSF